jgi:hypothetical protein
MNKWIENIVFMLLPIMVSGIIYLFSSVTELQKQIELTALARLQMKIEIGQEVLANRERIHELENRIVVLETQQVKK